MVIVTKGDSDDDAIIKPTYLVPDAVQERLPAYWL